MRIHIQDEIVAYIGIELLRPASWLPPDPVERAERL